MPVFSTDTPFEYLPVAATSDGVNEVIPAVTGKKILVLGYVLNVNAAGVITLQDSDDAAIGSFELTDGGVVSYAGGLECPAFVIDEGLAFEISNANGVDTLGHITFAYV